MTLYQRVFAALYDPVLSVAERAGLRELRRTVLAEASGRVLELGAGSGLNLPLYPDRVTQLTCAEPDPAMRRRLERRAARERVRAEVVDAPGERLPAADASVDTVVSTLVLCTVADVGATLAEVRRVLAPGGRLVLIEHVRAADERTRRWQERWHGPWRAFAAGCHTNRDTVAALDAAGFDTAALGNTRWRWMPSIVAPLVHGSARPVGG